MAPNKVTVTLDETQLERIRALVEAGSASSGTDDIVDAHVVICARRAAQHVATSDPDDLRALDPDLQVFLV